MELHYLSKNPFQQFHDWYKEAEIKSGQKYPNAMCLATADGDGKPSVRMVLLKGVTEEGFAFYTNYESHKGHDLQQNPQAALCFYWDRCNHQVRVEGKVEKVSRKETQEYFESRPRGSQIGAWASQQSKAIASRKELEERFHQEETRFHGVEKIPAPDTWGGYLLKPELFEFWSEQPNRLHDRFVYSKEGEQWAVRRLSP